MDYSKMIRRAMELAKPYGLPHAAHDPSKPTYLRVGPWNPKSEYSRNYIGGDIEPGLSVYDVDTSKLGRPIAPEGEWAAVDMAERMRSKDPRFFVQGELAGIGGDEEPLLSGVRVVYPFWQRRPK